MTICLYCALRGLIIPLITNAHSWICPNCGHHGSRPL